MKLFADKNGVRKNALILDEKELFSELEEKKGTTLFLGKYPLREVNAVLRKKNFAREAQRRGLWPLEMDLDSSEFPPLQRLQIFYRKKSPENLIVDLKVREGLFKAKDCSVLAGPLPSMKCLFLEWLTLQNPLHSFAGERIPLPGQNMPGLGLGRKVLMLFAYVARFNRNDAVLAFPAYFHNAWLFLQKFHFLNPEKEAEVYAIRKTFSSVSFKDLAWIVHLNCLVREDGTVFEWHAEEQLFPINRDIRRYFDSPAYKKRFKDALQNQKFRINYERYRMKRPG